MGSEGFVDRDRYWQKKMNTSSVDDGNFSLTVLTVVIGEVSDEMGWVGNFDF